MREINEGEREKVRGRPREAGRERETKGTKEKGESLYIFC